MGKENGLSKTITDHNDAQPDSGGSWANAWVPVWEETPIASAANPHPKAKIPEPQSSEAPASEEPSKTKEAEEIHA